MELWFSEMHTNNVKFSVKVKKHIYHAKSKFQEIDFFNSDEFGVFFTLDGLMMVNEKDEFIYHEMISHVPMSTNDKIEKILIIGGGDGGTARELLKYPFIKIIHIVEIDKMVVDACKKFLSITASKLNDKRVSIFYEDGNIFIKNKKNFYDLIIIDSTDPVGPGKELFKNIFYKNCFKALTKNGILINQHESPFYIRDRKAMINSHKKIRSYFPISKVYQFHMPTYPSGHWLFGFASKNIDPIKNLNTKKWNKFNIKTRYYNTEIHKGAFCLPNYVIKTLNECKIG